VPGVTESLKFTPQILADIFMGKINNWNDAAISKVNPEAKFPNTPIVVSIVRTAANHLRVHRLPIQR